MSDTAECGVLVSLLLPFVSAANYKVEMFVFRLVCAFNFTIRNIRRGFWSLCKTCSLEWMM